MSKQQNRLIKFTPSSKNGLNNAPKTSLVNNPHGFTPQNVNYNSISQIIIIIIIII